MHKILILDDDRVNIVLAKKFLSSEYEPVPFTSPFEALEYLQENKVDLVLLDIQMPEMDGFQVIDKLRANDVTKDIPVIFLTADRSESTEEACFKRGAVDYISKPFVPEIMLQRIRRCLELEYYRSNLEQTIQLQLYRIAQLQQDFITTIANLIESRDGTTGKHVQRTAEYVAYLVKRMVKKGLYIDELTLSVQKTMYKAAPLHDIGKIKIPDRILLKNGKLTPEEYEEIKTHAQIGSDIIKKGLSSVEDPDFIQIACDMASYHHEKWNGQGYPKGLKEKEIPLSARILAVVDVFDALVSKRSYKDSMSLEEAYKIMEPDRGIAFESCIFDTFFEDKEDLDKFRSNLN